MRGLARWLVSLPLCPSTRGSAGRATRLEPALARVAIVGSGVAGALLAWKLASSGWEVAVFEAGPRVDRARAVARFAARERLSDTYPASPDQPGWENDHAFYEQRGPQPFTAVYERVRGGTTWHWLGTALRFLESDFRMHTRYGVGTDWPLALADLEPFYAEAERELGVSGAHLPALPPTYLDGQVGRAALQLGYRVEVLPAARNSVDYDGRPACRGSATCLPICPIGAKYDATVHLKRAEKSGARVLIQSPVQRLIAVEGRVAALEYLQSGQRHRWEADLFVVAANAIETPRLLLRSELPNPWVGRFLMGMAGQVSQALAPRPVWPFRSPQVVSGITQFRDGPFRKSRAGLLLSIGNDGWPEGSPSKVAERLRKEGLRGESLRRAIFDHVSRQLLLVSNCEELPRAENRVTLSHLVDSSGVPRPRIHFKVGQYTRESIDESVLIHARIFQAMGATHIHHFEESSDPAHLAGTCRMGSPGESVVDSDLRSHQWPNLRVLGSSVFPTCGSAPPTLTIAALALRLAQNLGRAG